MHILYFQVHYHRHPKQANTNFMNVHWRPVLQQCSIFSLNYKVYVKMENFKEDMNFFKIMANVKDKQQNIAKSNSGAKLVEPKEFWSTVNMGWDI